jgi:NodT family efflux transporter outer membrane factor (OMF) lipoprotein
MHGLPFRLLSSMLGPATAACASVLVFALAGCATTGPDRHASAQPSIERQEGPAQPDPRSPDWWAVLNDPILVGLLERLEKEDLDLSEAMTRLREARGRRSVLGADRFPLISATRTQDSDETDPDRTNEWYFEAYDAGWEMDVFGGPRAATRATEAELEVGVEDVRDLFVTLFAEVALNYVEVRSLQSRLSLANEHIASQSEIYIVTPWRRKERVARKRDLERARLNLDETRAQIPNLEMGLAEAQHRLAVLLGISPDELLAELAAPGAVPSARLGLAVGVPANTLRQRPDVRRAERDLVAQVDPVKTGPDQRFSLSGSIGLDAMSRAARVSLIQRNVDWTPFDADSIRQKIKVRTPLQEQALTDYEIAVITALKEVDDVLVAYTKGEAHRESLERAVEAAKSAAEVADKRYISDKVSFDAVRTARRSLLSLQDQLATSEGEVASNFIRLYKALGGGWAPLDGTARRPDTSRSQPSIGEDDRVVN